MDSYERDAIRAKCDRSIIRWIISGAVTLIILGTIIGASYGWNVRKLHETQKTTRYEVIADAITESVSHIWKK